MPTHPGRLLMLTLAAARPRCGTDTAPGTNDTSTTGAPRDTSTGATSTDTGADKQGETQDASSGGLGGTGTTQPDTGDESSTGTPVCSDGEVQSDEECDDPLTTGPAVPAIAWRHCEADDETRTVRAW